MKHTPFDKKPARLPVRPVAYPGANLIGLARYLFFLSCVLVFSSAAYPQTAAELVQKVREKLDKVNDYEANGTMKMNVTFIKAPVSTIKIYYKKPDKSKIHNEKGISLIPKGTVNISIGAILLNAGSYDIVDAGKEDKTGLRIVKLLPRDENANVVLSTFYIDEKQLLVKKAKTTTRDNGTYELELEYGRYAAYGLADKVIFSFNVKDYKLPKGVSFDYNGSNGKTQPDKPEDKKGKIEISYTDYKLNKGVPDSVFQ